MFTLLITLLFGITLGTLLGTICLLYLIKIKCPSCKKLKLIKEVVLFHWRDRIITGQSCQKCQKPKPQIEITL